MIVVVGQPFLRGSGSVARAGGLAAGVAVTAAASGSAVEFIGKIGDDPAGDELQLSLARSHVGHVAMLRDPSRPTGVVAPARDETGGADDPIDAMSESPPDADDGQPEGDGAASAGGPELEAADIGLALRYLTDYRVVVVAYPRTPEVTAEASAAAAWAGAHLIVIVRPGEPAPVDLTADAVVMAMTPTDGEELGALIGSYAAAVDRGEEPSTAFAAVRALATAEPGG